MLFLCSLKTLLETQDFILPRKKHQYIALFFGEVQLEDCIEGSLEVALEWFKHIVHFCGVRATLDVDKSVSIEKSHKFAGFNSCRHDDELEASSFCLGLKLLLQN